MCDILVYSHTPGCSFLEEDTVLSVTSGVRGQVRNKALDLHILPSREVPTFVSVKYVPWINWTILPYTSEGVADYIGSFYSYDTTSFQIVNNTDSILYITGGIPERGSLITGPEVIIGPYKGSNITLSSSSVTILARCFGYDFTTTRAKRGFLDTRGPSSYVEVRGLRQGDNPPLPVLRSSWQRFYDLYDLTLGNPLPAPHTTGVAWYSNPLDFSGSVSVVLNIVCTATAVPTAGVYALGFVSISGIATGLGNFTAGGSSIVSQVGNNYVINDVILASGNLPALELNFEAGDLNGCAITYIDMWLAAEVTG